MPLLQPEEIQATKDFTEFDLQTRTPEFVRLPLEQKERLLQESLRRTAQTLSPLPNAQERYESMVKDLYSEVLPRIYHGKDVDYSQGRIRTAFNNFMRGAINDSFLSIGKSLGAVWDAHKEEPDNFLYRLSTKLEKDVDEIFKDNPELIATGGIARGVGQIAGIAIPTGVTGLATRAGLRASQAARMSQLAQTLTEVGDFQKAGQTLALAQKLKQASDAGYMIARLQATAQVAGLTFDEARELGLDAGLDPQEATQRALRVMPFATALNMVPMEKIFRAYRIIGGKDTVADVLIKAGVRDKFMPVYAKKVVSGLLKNAEIGFAEGATEALESLIRYPLVINEPAPWSEVLTDGGLGTAVGMIVGLPTSIRSALPNKRRVTYEQALADLDNISSVLDGYSDKLTPYQREIKKLLDTALEQEAVSPKFITDFLNVELVNTPEQSDNPQRVGTKGQVSQIFSETSFIQQAAEELEKENQQQAEQQQQAPVEQQTEQKQETITEQPATTETPTQQETGQSPAPVEQVQQQPTQAPTEALQTPSDASVEPPAPVGTQPETSQQTPEQTQTQEAVGVEQTQNIASQEEAAQQQETAEQEQAIEQTPIQPTPIEQNRPTLLLAQFSSVPETKAAYVEGVNQTVDTMLSSKEGTELQQFPAQVADKIVLEAAQEAVTLADPVVEDVESPEVASALAQDTVNQIISDKVGEIKDRTNINSPVPPTTLQNEVAQETRSTQRIDAESIDAISSFVSSWASSHSEEYIAAQQPQDIINIPEFDRLHNSVKDFFPNKNDFASFILRQKNKTIRSWLDASTQFADKTPQEINKIIKDLAQKDGNYKEIVLGVHAIAIRGLQNVKTKEAQKDERNEFEEEELIYQPPKPQEAVTDGFILKRTYAQLYRDGELVAAAQIGNGAVNYIGEKTTVNDGAQLLAELEKRGINVFYPFNSKVSSREIQVLSGYVYSPNLHVPSRATLKRTNDVTLRYGFGGKNKESNDLLREYQTIVLNKINAVFAALPADAEVYRENVIDKLVNGSTYVIGTDDGRQITLFEAFLNNDPIAISYVNQAIANAQMSYIRKRQRRATESLEALQTDEQGNPTDFDVAQSQPQETEDITEEEMQGRAKELATAVNLSERQKKIYDFMVDYAFRNGEPATASAINQAKIVKGRVTSDEIFEILQKLKRGESLRAMAANGAGGANIPVDTVSKNFVTAIKEAFASEKNVTLIETQEARMPETRLNENGDIVITYNPQFLTKDINSVAVNNEQALERLDKIIQEEIIHAHQYLHARKDKSQKLRYVALAVHVRKNPTKISKLFEQQRIDHAGMSDFEYGAELVRWTAQKLVDNKTTEETINSAYDSGIIDILRKFVDYLLSLAGNTTTDGKIKQEALSILQSITTRINPNTSAGRLFAESVFKKTSPIEVLRARELIKTEAFKPYRELGAAFLDEVSRATNMQEVEQVIAKYRYAESKDITERGKNRLMVVNMLSGIVRKQQILKSGNGRETDMIGELFFQDLDEAVRTGIENSNDPMIQASLRTSNAGRILRLWQEFIKSDPDLFAAYGLRNLYRSVQRGLSLPAQEFIQKLLKETHEQNEAQKIIIGELKQKIKQLEKDLEAENTKNRKRLADAVGRAETVNNRNAQRRKRISDILIESMRATGGVVDAKDFAQRLQSNYNVDYDFALEQATKFIANAQQKIQAASERYISEVIRNTISQMGGRLGASFSKKIQSDEVRNALKERFQKGQGISMTDVIRIVAKMEGINITDEILQKYADLHKKFADVGGNGIPAQNLMNDINDIERSLKGIGLLDAMFAIRKMFMLLGPRTLFLTGVGTGVASALNVAARLAADKTKGRLRWSDIGFMLSQMPVLLRNSLVRGVAAFRSQNVMKSDIVKESFVIESLRRGVPVASNVLPQGVTESDLFRTFVRHAAGFASLSGRSLSFADKMFSSLAHDLYLMSRSSEAGMSVRDFYEKYFSPTSEQIKNARAQAQDEVNQGLITEKQVEARVIEITEQMVPQQLLLKAQNFAAMSAFQEAENAITEVLEDGEIVTKRAAEKMNGVLGYIGRIFNRARMSDKAAIRYPAEYYFAFVTTPINVINWGMNFTPWGYIRAMNPNGIYKLTPEQVELVRAQATMGTITMLSLLLMALLDDDDDVPTFTITGNLKSVGDETKRRQLQDIGLKPYTIKVGPVYLDYRDILPSLAFVGNIIDEYRYGRRDEAGINRVAMSMLGGMLNGATVMADMTMLETVGSILSDTNNPNFDTEKATDRLVKSMVRSAVPFVMPQVFKDIEAWAFSFTEDGAVRSYRDKDFVKFVLVQIPFVRHWAGEKPAFNVLGEPILDARLPWERVVKVVEKDELLDFYGTYLARGGRVPVPGPTTKILGEKASDDALYVLQRNTLQNMAKMFRNTDLQRLRMLDFEVQKEIVRNVYKDAHDIAKVQAEVVQAKYLREKNQKN